MSHLIFYKAIYSYISLQALCYCYTQKQGIRRASLHQPQASTPSRDGNDCKPLPSDFYIHATKVVPGVFSHILGPASHAMWR